MPTVYGYANLWVMIPAPFAIYLHCYWQNLPNCDDDVKLTTKLADK